MNEEICVIIDDRNILNSNLVLACTDKPNFDTILDLINKLDGNLYFVAKKLGIRLFDLEKIVNENEVLKTTVLEKEKELDYIAKGLESEIIKNINPFSPNKIQSDILLNKIKTIDKAKDDKKDTSTDRVINITVVPPAGVENAHFMKEIKMLENKEEF